MPLAITYATVKSAETDRDKVSAVLGWPRCARLAGHTVGAVPACACKGDGVGANVDATCPYATRQETDVFVDKVGIPCLLVNAKMESDPAVRAAVPVASAKQVAYPDPGPIAVSAAVVAEVVP